MHICSIVKSPCTASTSGRPSVIVPVLSKTIVSMLFARSKASASFTRIPFSAARPMPTISAVGVAKPKAQGQATTSTVTAFKRARVSALSPGILSKSSQAKKEIKAMSITVGTKTPATLSTSRRMGALLFCASCTKAIMRASIVALPTLSARKLKLPFWLIVPSKTLLPTCFSTGTGSPLKRLSSTYELPAVIVPSTGTFSPGRTTRTSPLRTSAILMLSCVPSAFKRIVSCGRRPISLRREAAVPYFARASSKRPIKIKVITPQEESK